MKAAAAVRTRELQSLVAITTFRRARLKLYDGSESDSICIQSVFYFLLKMVLYFAQFYMTFLFKTCVFLI